MHFKVPSLIATLALAGLASTTPLIKERQTTTTPPDRYYLQTKVVGNSSADTGTNKDGLWVYSSHTGAGLGDACLSSNKSIAWEGYLNGTEQLFTYPGAQFPWPFAVGGGFYQGWLPTTISVAESPNQYNPGFYFNATGLQYNVTYGGGWLVCDWWHGVPQLFSFVTNVYGPTPSTCSQVELYPIAV